MIVDFNKLSDNARVWIYPSNRSFYKEELGPLRRALTQFLSEWTAHNKDLEASFDIPYKHFIVIGVNQIKSQVTGCSIDSSVRFIQELEKQFDIILLEKMNVIFKEGENLTYVKLDQFIKMAKSKLVSDQTVVFNNLVNNIFDYKENWEIPLIDSWHNRLIK